MVKITGNGAISRISGSTKASKVSEKREAVTAKSGKKDPVKTLQALDHELQKVFCTHAQPPTAANEAVRLIIEKTPLLAHLPAEKKQQLIVKIQEDIGNDPNLTAYIERLIETSKGNV